MIATTTADAILAVGVSFSVAITLIGCTFAEAWGKRNRR